MFENIIYVMVKRGRKSTVLLTSCVPFPTQTFTACLFILVAVVTATRRYNLIEPCLSWSSICASRRLLCCCCVGRPWEYTYPFGPVHRPARVREFTLQGVVLPHGAETYTSALPFPALHVNDSEVHAAGIAGRGSPCSRWWSTQERTFRWTSPPFMCFYFYHFWHQMRGVYFLTWTDSPRPTGCLTIHFGSDTNYPDSSQTPEVKGSVPPECPRFRCQLQVQPSSTLGHPAKMDWVSAPCLTPSSVRQFARIAQEKLRVTLNLGLLIPHKEYNSATARLERCIGWGERGAQSFCGLSVCANPLAPWCIQLRSSPKRVV